MAIDLVLMERGLGVRFLETVTLVTPEGASCSDLSAHSQEFDRVLLDRIIETLADRSSAGRRQALQALAWLDPPGFFEGYVQELRSGGTGDCLDYLLTAGASVRLAARLGLDEDHLTAARLIALWQDEPQGARRRALTRLLLLCPDALRAKALEAIETGSDEARLLFSGIVEIGEFIAAFQRSFAEGSAASRCAALQACLPLLPLSAELRAALLGAVRKPGPAERSTVALVDHCLAVMGPWIEDGDLAVLVGSARRSAPIPAGSLQESGSGSVSPAYISLKGVLEVAGRQGGRQSLEAVRSRLQKDGAEKLQALLAIRSMARRLEIDLLESSARAGSSGLSPACEAALLLALSDDGERRSVAAGLLFEEVAAGRAEADLVSLAGAAEICEHFRILLSPAASGDAAIPPDLRAALIRSPLLRRDALDANMIRLELGALLGDKMDPILDRALWATASVDEPGAYTVEIRLF
jgi:hypothetical protein